MFEEPTLTPSIAEKHDIVFRRVKKLFTLNLEERWAAITGNELNPVASNIASTETIYPYDASTSGRAGLNGVILFIFKLTCVVFEISVLDMEHI